MIHANSSPSDSDSRALDDEPEKQDRLLSITFLGLLLTQFLGATNDNVLRWLVIGIGKEYVKTGRVNLEPSTVLAIGSACFVLPYILFAAPAGYLADRFSKRTVIVTCKFAEIVIMIARRDGDRHRQRLPDVRQSSR